MREKTTISGDFGMSKIEKIASRISHRIKISDKSIENAQEVKNAVFNEVCSEFTFRLPGESLLVESNDDFNDDDAGEWGGQENKAARTMQTIYNMAMEIAKNKNTIDAET